MLLGGYDNFDISTFHYSIPLVSTDCCFLLTTGISFFMDKRLKSSKGIGTGGLDFLRLNSVSYP